MNKFKLGDRVKINPSSKYKKQIHSDAIIGTIYEVNNTSVFTDLPYSVRFTDGYTNSYGAKDLMIAKGYVNKRIYDKNGREVLE